MPLWADCERIMNRLKVNHYKFGTCWIDKIDSETYSIPMAFVYSDKLGENIVRSLLEFELCPDTLYPSDSLVFRYCSQNTIAEKPY